MNIASSFYKLKKVKDLLALTSNSSHACILCSQDNIFLDAFSKLMVLSHVCKNNICFDCPDCKKVLDGNAIDVLRYGFEKSVVVEDSQNIVAESYVVPLEFENKYFIIKDIDKATVSAQNKLLKIIEEPKSFDRYIFLTNSIDAVLPTIKSRCVVHNLPKLDSTELLALCQDNKMSVESYTTVEYANGSFQKLCEIANDEHFKTLYQLSLSVLTNMKNSSNVLEFSSKILSYKDQFSKFIDILYSFFADLLCLKQNKAELIKNKNIQNQLNVLQAQYSELAIIKILEYIASVPEKMRFNININFIVDNLLLKILEIKFLCK